MVARRPGAGPSAVFRAMIAVTNTQDTSTSTPSSDSGCRRPHGIIAPGQSPMQLATELVVATRPLADILPDVRDRLVRHLMAGWRTTA